MIEFQNRQIKLKDGSQCVVSRIIGAIDGSTLQQFDEKLLSFLQDGSKYLILVFSQVRYINSTGMGILVKLADKFNEIDGEMILVDVPEKLVALFNMLGLLALIKLAKNEEDAVKLFHEDKKGSAVKAKLPTEALENKVTSRSATTKHTPAPEVLATIPHHAPVTTVGATSHPAAIAKPKTAAKFLLVYCKKCHAKISLGSQLHAGTYRCPLCKIVFKVFETGKITFLPS